MNKKEDTTILQRFIRDRVASYREPQRAGTPKGELIGLSRTKYEATLWMLTNHLQKDLAPMLDISYGLLRKWNSEEEFLAAIEKHRLDFVQVVLENLIRRANTSVVACAEHGAGQVSNHAKSEDGSYDEFEDAGSYDEALLEMIYSSLMKKMTSQGGEACQSCQAAIALEIYSFIHALMRYRGYLQEVVRRSDERLKKKSHGCLLDYMRDVLEGPKADTGKSWAAAAMLARMKKVDKE